MDNLYLRQGNKWVKFPKIITESGLVVEATIESLEKAIVITNSNVDLENKLKISEKDNENLKSANEILQDKINNLQHKEKYLKSVIMEFDDISPYNWFSDKMVMLERENKNLKTKNKSLLSKKNDCELLTICLNSAMKEIDSYKKEIESLHMNEVALVEKMERLSSENFQLFYDNKKWKEMYFRS